MPGIVQARATISPLLPFAAGNGYADSTGGVLECQPVEVSLSCLVFLATADKLKMRYPFPIADGRKQVVFAETFTALSRLKKRAKLAINCIC
ncbi:hypothetical protein KL86DES1_22014 [uncultured Desulfovibrio sp.]|uniref:Uncharacterized protein n=1 Tax=uncultured Desulfovibrio sp. TaxID=167968 RepID=A0A212LAJ3_9BACT|nr:hypothetical protein KL86DES1_22014 [uncultured Desulfovibrio sp.]VZH34906.1 conserved protein of unknown function [Desulfovibrio sp. 86]